MKVISAHLKFGSGCQIENRIYFCNIAFNGLFYIDIKDYTIHYVCKFPNEPVGVNNLSICDSILYDNMIYFFPFSSNKIMGYDVVKQKSQYIAIGDCNKNCMIGSVVRKKDLVYVFPTELGNGIYIFDLKMRKVKKDEELSALFVTGFWTNGLICYDSCDCVFIGEYGSGRLLKLNLETKQIVFYRNFEEFQFYIIKYNRSHLWILPMDSANIFEWDEADDRLRIYSNNNVEYAGKPVYVNLIFLEDEILTINCFLKNMFRIDEEKGIIDNPIVFPKEIRMANSFFRGCAFYDNYTVLDDRVLIYPSAGNMLLIYNRMTKKLFIKDMVITEKEVPYLREVLGEKFLNEKPYTESDELGTLEEFIDSLKINSNSGKNLVNREIGKLICQECLV